MFHFHTKSLPKNIPQTKNKTHIFSKIRFGAKKKHQVIQCDLSIPQSKVKRSQKIARYQDFVKKHIKFFLIDGFSTHLWQKWTSNWIIFPEIKNIWNHQPPSIWKNFPYTPWNQQPATARKPYLKTELVFHTQQTWTHPCNHCWLLRIEAWPACSWTYLE